jgi:hypothetical protein
MYGYSNDKKDLLGRLRRLRDRSEVFSGWSEDQYCIDIPTRVNSVTTALRRWASGCRTSACTSARWLDSVRSTGCVTAESLRACLHQVAKHAQ